MYLEMVMCLGLCGGYIFVGYDIGLCGSELVLIPGWVGVESSWVGVEFTLKVVWLEDGTFPTTTLTTTDSLTLTLTSCSRTTLYNHFYFY